jgi:HEAT repeat protein
MHERLQAVSQLAERNDAESFAILTELCDDSEIRVARSSVRVIASRKNNPKSAELLEKIAKTSPHGAIRGAAAAGLGYFKKTDYKLLTAMMLDDEDPAARAGAAMGLKRLHNHASRDALLEAMGDPDLYVRINAHKAIGALTARWLAFDPKAAKEVRSEQLKAIKRGLAGISAPHGH